LSDFGEARQRLRQKEPVIGDSGDAAQPLGPLQRGRCYARRKNVLRPGPSRTRDGAATFKDRSGVGRNLTIQILEYLDAMAVTRRAGDARIVLHGRKVFG